MARTIGNKRGSVRGAPPQAYLPFGDYSNPKDRDPWEDAFRIGKHYGIITFALCICVVIFCCLRSLDIIPYDLD